MRAARIDWDGSPEMADFLAGLVPGRTWRQCSDAFAERFGVALTESQVKSFKRRRGLRSGLAGVPRAEWMGEESLARCEATQFRPGHLPHNAREVGEERVNGEGYVEVHVSRFRRERANDQWVLKQRLVWEQANGRELGPDEVVVFCDGDRRNLDPGNLVAVTRAQHMELTRMGRPYCDRQTLEAALAVADLKAATAAAARRPRACAACGEEFAPRFARQARCDACIASGRKAAR